MYGESVSDIAKTSTPNQQSASLYQDNKKQVACG
jgi:hypothetical protein